MQQRGRIKMDKSTHLPRFKLYFGKNTCILGHHFNLVEVVKLLIQQYMYSLKGRKETANSVISIMAYLSFII
jgi:hypothetical protein